MCGRYVLSLQEKLHERFQTTNRLDLVPSFNVAPGQAMPVIVQNPTGIHAEIMKWGLVPSWAKDPKIGYKMINARAETVAEKPSYRAAMKRRRCLVPATGFYEWKAEGDGKTPMYIHPTDQKLFSFAGLYEIWQDDTGNELWTYTIITTEPNELMASIHNRMPVVLKREDEAEWLNFENEDAIQLHRLLAPYPAERMEAYPVSEAVNSPRNNVPSLIYPVTLSDDDNENIQNPL